MTIHYFGQNYDDTWKNVAILSDFRERIPVYLFSNNTVPDILLANCVVKTTPRFSSGEGQVFL